MLRAVRVGADVQVTQALTLDGELLAALSPTYEVLDGSIVRASGALVETSPAIYTATATLAAGVAADRARSSFTYAHLVVEESASVLDLTDAVVAVDVLEDALAVEVEGALVEVAVEEDELAVAVEEEVEAVDLSDQVTVVEVGA